MREIADDGVVLDHGGCVYDAMISHGRARIDHRLRHNDASRAYRRKARNSRGRVDRGVEIGINALGYRASDLIITDRNDEFAVLIFTPRIDLAEDGDAEDVGADLERVVEDADNKIARGKYAVDDDLCVTAAADNDYRFRHGNLPFLLRFLEFFDGRRCFGRDTLAAKDLFNGQKDGFYVDREAEMLHVPDVIFEFFFPRDRVSAVDLCPAGKPRTDVVAVLLDLVVEGKIFDEKRARTDDAHISAENVPELGKLVERGRAEQLSEFRQAHLVGQKLALFIALIRHRAELVKLEDALVFARTLLTKDHGRAELCADKYCYNQHNGGEKYQREKRQNYVEKSLYVLFIKCWLMFHFSSKKSFDYAANAVDIGIRHLCVARQTNAATEEITADALLGE